MVGALLESAPQFRTLARPTPHQSKHLLLLALRWVVCEQIIEFVQDKFEVFEFPESAVLDFAQELVGGRAGEAVLLRVEHVQVWVELPVLCVQPGRQVATGFFARCNRGRYGLARLLNQQFGAVLEVWAYWLRTFAKDFSLLFSAGCFDLCFVKVFNLRGS